MAFTPFSGTGGRVRLGGSVTRGGVVAAYPFAGSSNVAIAGVTNWRFPQHADKSEMTNFESPVDGNGRVWKEFLATLCGAQVRMEGVFDGDLTTGHVAAFNVAAFIVVDLLFYKNPPIGYFDLLVFVDDFESGQTLSSDGKATFSMTGTLQGPPSPGAYNQLAAITPASAAYPAEMNSQFPPTIISPG